MNPRRRNHLLLLLVAVLVAGAIVTVFEKPTRLGLDLQGGVQLVYQAEPLAGQDSLTADQLSQTLDLMRQRVDQLGVSEPELQQVGSSQIQVDLPDVRDPQRASEQVGSTAQLYLYDWEANVLDESCRTNATEINGGQTSINGLYAAVTQAAKCPAQTSEKAADAYPSSQSSRFYVFAKGNTHRPLNGGDPYNSRQAIEEDKTLPAAREVVEVKRGIIVVRDEKPSPTSAPPDTWWVLVDRPALSGRDIEDPQQTFDQGGSSSPIVSFNFSDRGRKLFQRTTARIAQRGAENAPIGTNAVNGSQHFAISLDNELISTPFINYQELPEGIDGANGAQISGGFTIQTAQDLARLLRIGALPVQLELISRSEVSATLGAVALEQGLKAGIVGFVIVALFLLLFYRVLGVVAVVALVIYGVYLFALVKLIPVTLTLPGIAGLILTLGVAADANIVVFERVKEEIRAGRPIRSAISIGYRKALGAIVDANVVTLLVAFILFILATAGVKGFALLLGLGTVLSLFTAVLATQAMLAGLAGTRLLRGKLALNAGADTGRLRFDYIGTSKWFFSASGMILIVGALAIGGLGVKFGIDFTSGTRISAPLEQTATVAQIREVLDNAGEQDAEIQTARETEGERRQVVQISSATLDPETGVGKVTQALDDRFGLADDPDISSVGPTFGKSVANSAILAIIASLLVISAYIGLRFEWKYAVPVLIALMHDILIVSGVYALLGREVTTSTVAALLTILGYSLYDTIIVFDRIRENVPRMPNAAFSQIVNRSMSEVITRSLATSLCTLLPILGLMLFGGETLQDFALALIIGVASGTYSSIFIATPILSHWKDREPVFRSRDRRIREANGGLIPAYAAPLAASVGDVAPKRSAGPRGGRRTGMLGTSGEPGEIGRAEFDQLVQDLGIDSGTGGASGARGTSAGRASVAGPSRSSTGGPSGASQPEGSDRSGTPVSEDPAGSERRDSGARKQRRKHGRAR